MTIRKPLPFALTALIFALAALSPISARDRSPAASTSASTSSGKSVSTREETALPGFAEMTVLMADEETSPEEGIDADTNATPSGREKLNPNFLGIPTSVNTHRILGYTAGGLLLAGGVVGTIRFLDLMDRSHARRDAGEGGDGDDENCGVIIHEEWADGQALRWTHVGLVATGETLYLFDAATGISMMKKGVQPSKAGRIHRDAFFVHAGLMAADVILGFLLTNALDKGNHGEVVAYGAAHAGIGIAIPVIIIGSGLAIDFMPRY